MSDNVRQNHHLYHSILRKKKEKKYICNRKVYIEALSTYHSEVAHIGQEEKK